MELICDKCGCIGFGFDAAGAHVEAKHHVEGYTRTRKDGTVKLVNKPHPGHIVTFKAEKPSAFTRAFSLRGR